MKVIKYGLAIFLLFNFAQFGIAQTIEKPISISLMSDATVVSAEHPSYVVFQFKIPKGMWMGPEPMKRERHRVRE